MDDNLGRCESCGVIVDESHLKSVDTAAGELVVCKDNCAPWYAVVE